MLDRLPTPPQTAAPRALLGLGALAVLVSGALTWLHPDLRLVDFLSFSNRAMRLAEGQDLLHPLYPVGYPALLLGAQLATGDVLLAGKLLSALAALGAALAAGRWLGPSAGLWLLAQLAWMRWGSTEGSDMPAAALSLAAVLCAAQRRAALAGLLVGLACLMRYTALAALPVVLLASGAPLRALGAFALATAPHWGVALWLGASPLPDQSANLAIGGGGGVLGWATQLARALRASLDLPAALGALGLGLAAWRGDRRARCLGAWAALHLAGLAWAFSNPRLALPATLAFALGAAWLLPRRALLPAALAVGAWSLNLERTPAPEEAHLAQGVELTAKLPGPLLSTHPGLYQRHQGWLMGARTLRGPELEPAHALRPEALLTFAQARGFRHVVVDTGRLIGTWPELAPMLTEPPAGLRRVAAAPGWVAWAVTPDPSRASQGPPRSGIVRHPPPRRDPQ